MARHKYSKKGSKTSYPHYRPSKVQRSFLKRFLRRIFVGGLVVITALLLWCSAGLPNIDSLNKFTKKPSIVIKSEDGQIIGTFGDVYGDYVAFDQMPASLVDAVIATEDRNFYHHYGVDPFGMLRAMVVDVRAGHMVQGGSTITQQVAKNVFLTPERSLTRKIREMLLALRLEQRFTKKEIMSIYLNRVYLGAGSYGIDAASKRYFDKPAHDLTLPESAIMAGLLKAPSRFAPTSNPALSKKRAEQVLLNMEDAGFLTDKQAAKAKDELAQSMSARKRDSQSAMYFADWIADQLPDYVGNLDQDVVVISTLRPELQALGEKAISGVMDKEGAAHDASQAAMVSMTPDGAVRVMIGGRSYAESQYNRATQALRQPGSSFKLFVYLAGLEDGMTPDTMVDDHPITIKIYGGYWSPKNYTNRYLGEIPLKEAVTESVNTIAVQVAQRVGVNNVVAMARRLGITSDLDPVPSIALGATEVTLLELTNAYAHLAANGRVVEPYGIVQITTASGDVLYEQETEDKGTALSEGIVDEMNDMLLNVVENGTARAARIGRPAAGKTGTTSDYRDAWFMGYTPDLVTGVWVGNDDNTEMKKVTGGMLPARIWHDFMLPALANTPAHDIPTSSGFFSSLLPWQDNPSHTFPAQPEEHNQPVNNPPPNESPPPVRRHNDVKLGKSFWDKLMR